MTDSSPPADPDHDADGSDPEQSGIEQPGVENPALEQPPEPNGSTIRSGERLDELALLEEERRFLLHSLRDLEREREAGDVDDVDYETLKDGYTVRAAGVLREIEAGRQALAPKRPFQWKRNLILVAASILVTAAIGFALASAFGERGARDEITGENLQPETNELLVGARAALNSGRFDRANELFVQADEKELAADRDNPEARAYVGWTFALLARAQNESDQTERRYEIALAALNQAIDMDPTYADPYCFAAIIEHRFLGDSEAALPYVDTCEASNPPAEVADLVSDFAAEIRAAT